MSERVPAGPGWAASNPARAVAALFAIAVGVGTVLLRLPMSREDDVATSWLDALFTATSAVCVTGLTVVDTGAHWSPVGEVVVLGLIQLGGLGIMTLASMVALLLNRRLGLGTRVLAGSERTAATAGEIRPLIVAVVKYSLAFEAAGAVLLFVGFVVIHGDGAADAGWSAVFHAVSAFNNAGFGLLPDSLSTFVDDWWTNGVVISLVVSGGLGFPVLMELRRRLQHRGRVKPRLSLHSRLTLVTTAGLLVFGTVALAMVEWSNPDTLGPMATAEKGLAAAFQSVQTRTAGFNSIDIGAMNTTSWLIMSVLMFIGGGSASTAGGIKVTTFALIALMIWSELRGDDDVHVFGRRFSSRAQRRAVAIAAISLGAVVVGGMAVISLTSVELDQSFFEVTSAFGTVGLSTGITATLPDTAKLVLIGLMYLGRLGPVTLGAALVLRERNLRFRYPEEQPIIG
jgi:trk system potassium uptake protein TrkH